MGFPYAKQLGLTIAVCAVASSALACNIPVFRYALERWKSDPYELVVFKSSETSRVRESFLSSADRLSVDGESLANVKVTRTKANDSDSHGVELRTQVRGRELVVWSGSVDAAADAKLFESPARTELADRLLSGDSVVWLIVGEVGKPAMTTVRGRLETAFRGQADTIRLPEGVGLPGSELFSEIPLLLQSSILEIDAGDPKETFLLELAKRLRPEVDIRTDPLVMPVFGRGRALEVIPASTLDARLIEDLTVFLSGACSCQVKERNPGFDLLMTAKWDSVLFGDGGDRPPVTSVNEPSAAPRMLTIPPGRKSLQK